MDNANRTEAYHKSRPGLILLNYGYRIRVKPLTLSEGM